MAPQRGLEPRTRWLTATCSTDWATGECREDFLTCFWIRVKVKNTKLFSGCRTNRRVLVYSPKIMISMRSGSVFYDINSIRGNQRALKLKSGFVMYEVKGSWKEEAIGSIISTGRSVFLRKPPSALSQGFLLHVHPVLFRSPVRISEFFINQIIASRLHTCRNRITLTPWLLNILVRYTIRCRGLLTIM